MVVVPARGDEGGLVAVPLLHLEPEDTSVERERAIDVRDLQVDVPDVDAGIDRRGGHAQTVTGGPRGS